MGGGIIHHSDYRKYHPKNAVCALNQQSTPGVWELDIGSRSDSLHYYPQKPTCKVFAFHVPTSLCSAVLAVLVPKKGIFLPETEQDFLFIGG